MPLVFSCCVTIDCHTSIPPGGSADCFVDVIDVTCPAATTGTVGTAYTSNASVSGGTGPYTYAIGAGGLPSGLSLNSSTGAITGTPTIAGVFAFMLEVTDANGTIGRIDCAIDIDPAPGSIGGGFLLQENGSYLLQEDGSRILLDPVATVPTIGGIA